MEEVKKGDTIVSVSKIEHTALFRYGLSVFVLVLYMTPIPFTVYAQDHGHSHGDEAKEVLEKAVKKKMTFKGYGTLRGGFRAICEGLREDGRIEVIANILKSHSERDPFCGACRPLFRTFQSECNFVIGKSKPKRSLVKKKVEEPVEDEESVEPTPMPTIPVPQREPSAVLIDRVSRVFNGIADDEAINHESVDAIAKLAFLLQDKNRMKGAEAEYFSIFVSYISAPFEGIQAVKVSPAAAEASEDKGANVDVLFDE